MIFRLRYLSLFLLPWLASCSSLYFPPPPQVPLFTQKGEFSGGIHTDWSSNTSLQGAYAVGEHIGVIGDASFLHSNKRKKAEDFDFGEFGAGYFTRIRDRRVLEFYGGYGFGKSKRVERDSRAGDVNLSVQGNLTKYFLQANYSSKESTTWHFFDRDWPVSYGTALRLSYMQLTDIKLNNAYHEPEDNIFLEPITYTRVQVLGPVQLQLISGSNFGLRHRKYLKAANSVFQLGIVVNLGGQEGKR
ncbi:hypothetical protein [Hymenobacter jejuensis]|uniref:Outer membrane protein beta-barrel domain-containing protein n=1 Tax=Hymenobacter jejuensis TaxID=2502781 RepID=A0A5B7ZYA3_9BACT|nr:hypothetical protein [Hymenobacter jejuensis]QDA59486.1 hypothetical protein FHG12_04910 [Hymenobacter jejuensis]